MKKDLGVDSFTKKDAIDNPNTVTQIKTTATDGYEAIQVGYEPAKEKHLTKAELGHFKKNGLNNYRHLQEFRIDNLLGLVYFFYRRNQSTSFIYQNKIINQAIV